MKFQLSYHHGRDLVGTESAPCRVAPSEYFKPIRAVFVFQEDLKSFLIPQN